MTLQRPLPSSVWLEALLALAGGLVGVWFHLLLSLLSNLALMWVVPLALVPAFFLMPRLFLATLLAAIFCQNLLLSLHAELAASPTVFQILQGSNFVFAAVGGALAGFDLVARRATLAPEVRRLVWLCLAFIALVAGFAVVGAQQSSFLSAATYFRFGVLGPLLLLFGLGGRVSPDFFRRLLMLFAGLLLAAGLFEFFFPLEFYELFNVDSFLALKWPERVELHNVLGLIEGATRNWLNLSGHFSLDFELLRLQGPALHPISFAYHLAFCALALMLFGLRLLPLALFLLLLVVGGKGAIILVLLPLLAMLLFVLTGQRLVYLAGLGLGLAVYVAGAVAYGLLVGDLHVLGLRTGLASLLTAPLGHGVGVGGNLSDLARAGRDYALFQREGPPFAIESALGVLVYQMGLAAAVLLLIFAQLERALLREAATQPRLLLMVGAVATLLANSLFQEETFSPAGWGLLLMLAGLLLGPWRERARA